MMQMIRLIHNENMKLYKRKMLWIMGGILVACLVLSLVFTYMGDDRSGDWQADVSQELKANQQMINDPELPEDFKGPARDAAEIAQYRLDHDVPPLFTDTALGFVKEGLSYSILITLFLIILSASIVSQEYSWGTMKMVLMRPVARWKVLIAKYFSVVFNGILMLLALAILSFIVGAICFGFDDMSLRYVYMQNGTVHDVSIFTHFLAFGGSRLVGIIMICAFALMISTLLKSNALAIALGIIIEFAGTVVGNMLALFDQDYVKYLFFNNTDLYQYFEGAPVVEGMTLGFSLIVLVIYLAIFLGVSLFVFQKRDVAG